MDKFVNEAITDLNDALLRWYGAVRLLQAILAAVRVDDNGNHYITSPGGGIRYLPDQLNAALQASRVYLEKQK